MYPYRDALSFESEHPLNSEPLRIDVIIIKKEREVVIENPIGAIFRGVNLVEYKSPGDHLSIKDFHKVGAYARLYSALSDVEVTDITVSFVVEAHPQKLLEYLRKVYRYEIREERSGIYQVIGDMVGIQIIESKRLGEGSALWLKSLRVGLNGEWLRKIIETSREMPKGAPLSAYIHVLLQANSSGFREVLRMSDASFEAVLEEFGLPAKWKAKGREEGREEDVKRLQKYGMEPGQIAEALELPLSTVFKYLNAPE
ncbi:MAG: hypothetical protein LBR93_00555 [Treponema sp.]|nr:hypothetical protein [Treponema sp.]